MYTVRPLDIGQIKTRNEVLEEAVTYVLNLVRLVAFPEGTWTIEPTTFRRREAQVMQVANDTRPGGMAFFQYSDAREALIQRGYRPGVLPIVRSHVPPPDAAPQPVPPTPPQPVTPPVVPPATHAVIGYQNRVPGKVTLPVIVPPSPTFPTPPPVVAEKKSPDYFLWIAGLLALYVFGSESGPIRSQKRSRRKKPASGNPSLKGLSGKFANCLLWQEVESKQTGGTIWRCMSYGPTCKGKTCHPSTRKFQTRSCVKTKTVPTKAPRFKRATVQRCAKYEKTCLTSSCLPEPRPKPEPSAQHGRNIKRMAKELAQSMAAERNDALDVEKELGREILERGGLRPYKYSSEGSLRTAKKKTHEEFKPVPLFLRRKTGKPLDEMASEMGFEDDTALMEALRREYPGTHGKKKQRWTASDFTFVAEDIVRDMLETPGYTGGLGQGLFPGLKRELVLKQDDIATSDDPLDIHLQRKGWKLPRVRELQASISEKMTPDMFTGKTKKLSAGEVELQRDISDFLDSSKARRTRPKTTPPLPPNGFWVEQPSQQNLFGFSGMSNERIAEGVRKAVKEDGKRKAHGDTSLRAFFITPDLEIIPWKEQQRVPTHGENVSVHSHSAENYNYLRQLTGKREPESRFSVGDLGIFRNQIIRGLVDTDALIMGDGRMYVLRCDLKTSYLPDASNKSLAQSKLPKNWYTKAKYKNLSHPQAAQKKQREYLQRKGCSWTETYWKDPDAEQPMLFHLVPRERREYIEMAARDPEKEYTIPKGEKKPDLTKEYSVKIPRGFYPTDLAQQELFTMPQRTRRSSRGEKRITMPPESEPVQIRLLGGKYARL